MVDRNNNSNGLPPKKGKPNSAEEYLARAGEAVADGDKVLGMHLYLAAYERAVHSDMQPLKPALDGLRKAWALACSLKERSMAEYIFEKLEPTLSADEIAIHAEQLQRLALDKLSEFGLSRNQIEDMAQMISQDFADFIPSADPTIHASLPFSVMGFGSHVPRMCKKSSADTPGTPDLDEIVHRQIESPEQAEDAEASLTAQPADTTASNPEADTIMSAIEKRLFESAGSVSAAVLGAPSTDAANAHAKAEERFDYSAIVGFDRPIERMREFGIGTKGDAEFARFLSLMNERHGLASAPSIGTVVFSADAREDANYFMIATVGEMGLPAVRMRMDTNAQGLPILCVMASSDFHPRLSSLSQNGFEGPAVLILEDLDLWGLSFEDGMADGLAALSYAQLSRGAREAVSMIRTAIESPDVTVFVSASDADSIEELFLDMFGRFSLVEIAYPDPGERLAIWQQALIDHPSLRGVPIDDAVRFSSTMSRFEISHIAEEAVDDAYRRGLAAREYMPVNPLDLFEKLACFQSLDSAEYREIESMLVSSFSSELDDVDSLLEGE